MILWFYLISAWVSLGMLLVITLNEYQILKVIPTAFDDYSVHVSDVFVGYVFSVIPILNTFVAVILVHYFYRQLLPVIEKVNSGKHVSVSSGMDGGLSVVFDDDADMQDH